MSLASSLYKWNDLVMTGRAGSGTFLKAWKSLCSNSVYCQCWYSEVWLSQKIPTSVASSISHSQVFLHLCLLMWGWGLTGWLLWHWNSAFLYLGCSLGTWPEGHTDEPSCLKLYATELGGALKRSSFSCPHSSSVVRAMRRPSTYCSRVFLGYLYVNYSSSTHRTPSNIADESLNPFSWAIFLSFSLVCLPKGSEHSSADFLSQLSLVKSWLL